MKLNYDLIRNIMLAIESVPINEPITQVNIIEHSLLRKYSYEELDHTIAIMYEAGLLPQSQVQIEPDAVQYELHSLTWRGYEYLNSIREQSVWNTIHEKIESKYGSLPFESVKYAAEKIIQYGIDTIISPN